MGALFDRPSVLVIALIAIIVIFGSKRLPDAARGVGRSLRILKAETKGLMTDDEAPAAPQQVQQAQPPHVQAPQVQAPPVPAPQVQTQPVTPSPAPAPVTAPAPPPAPGPVPAAPAEPAAPEAEQHHG